jgi:ABC-2 type transport system permease protein
MRSTVAIVRSELVRLRRRGFVLGWFGITAFLAVLINLVMFRTVTGAAAAPQDGPGVAFPSLAELLGKEGIVAGLSAASSIFGVVALSFWALATASDYSSGLVRVLVAAQPRRSRLVLGKWLALTAFTALATLVAVGANVLAAPLAARVAGRDPVAWGADLVAVAGRGTLDLFLCLVVWGSIGLGLVILTRSAGVAIGLGIGYVLLLEQVVKAAVSDDIGRWLPGSTLSALAHGGTDELPYGGALGLGGAYIVATVLAAVLVFARRDITD